MHCTTIALAAICVVVVSGEPQCTKPGGCGSSPVCGPLEDPVVGKPQRDWYCRPLFTPAWELMQLRTCLCKRGYVRNSWGECIPRIKCIPCKFQWQRDYHTCASACPATCNKPLETSCQKPCYAGCDCPPGWVVHPNNWHMCIRHRKCPPICPAHSTYVQCVSNCSPKCGKSPPSKCVTDCNVGACVCNKGFAEFERRGVKMCVLQEMCSWYTRQTSMFTRKGIARSVSPGVAHQPVSVTLRDRSVRLQANGTPGGVAARSHTETSHSTITRTHFSNGTKMTSERRIINVPGGNVNTHVIVHTVSLQSSPNAVSGANIVPTAAQNTHSLHSGGHLSVATTVNKEVTLSTNTAALPRALGLPIEGAHSAAISITRRGGARAGTVRELLPHVTEHFWKTTRTSSENSRSVATAAGARETVRTAATRLPSSLLLGGSGARTATEVKPSSRAEGHLLTVIRSTSQVTTPRFTARPVGYGVDARLQIQRSHATIVPGRVSKGRSTERTQYPGAIIPIPHITGTLQEARPPYRAVQNGTFAAHVQSVNTTLPTKTGNGSDFDIDLWLALGLRFSPWYLPLHTNNLFGVPRRRYYLWPAYLQCPETYRWSDSRLLPWALSSSTPAGYNGTSYMLYPWGAPFHGTRWIWWG
ncbi:uncharacterized protein LOC119464071 [Dermacentor silvarum]|uniref:uncharacterized protein LOC119464071 n=1 Tax=Dermacentor silvarum TaxID=543639 RepID=UPI00189B7557|nr:uncharacterized protein LOC119464071 [Dermacentor silvarum]